MNKALVLFLSLIVLSAPAFAARPLVTDDFKTVRTGKIRIEAGSNSSVPRAGGDTIGSATFQVKYGLADNMDFGVKIPYSFSVPVGLGDAVLRAKLKLIQTGENDGLSLRADIKLSNADTSIGLGSGYKDYAAVIIYSREISGYRTHYNLGYALVGIAPGAAAADQIEYSAAVERRVSPGADIICEYYGTSASTGAAGNIQIGGKWQTSEHYRVDVGYSVALNDNSNNVSTFGVTADF
ncbi:MAG: transporter [Candidatus Margulisiibacteriota bacterium]